MSTDSVGNLDRCAKTLCRDLIPSAWLADKATAQWAHWRKPVSGKIAWNFVRLDDLTGIKDWHNGLFLGR